MAVKKRCGYVDVDFDRRVSRDSTGISSRFIGSAASLKIQGASQIVLDLVNHDQAARIVSFFFTTGGELSTYREDRCGRGRFRRR